jgi:hypothetical protein
MLGDGSARAGEPAPGVCKLTPPTLDRLGYRTLPAEMSRADVEKVKRARKAVAKRDWTTAKELLEPLAAAYSEELEVRLLLAAWQASQGAASDACSAIAHLLELDLPESSWRFDRDPAFANLRQSPDGVRLAEHAKAVAALWRQAAGEGLPSVMARGTRDVLDIWSTKYLRGGVYLHETKRFLPLAPPVQGAAAILVHPKANRTAVVNLAVDPCRSDHCPRVDAVEVRDYSLDDFLRQPARWRYSGEDAQPLELRSSASGLEARVHDCCCYKNCVAPWKAVGSKPPAPASATNETMTLRVDSRGGLLAATTASLQLRKGRLVSGDEELALDPQHADASAVHDLLADPSTGARLILSTVDKCQCGGKHEGPILRHVLSRVDADGKATVLTSGKGPAAALLDGKGAFYLQTGDSVRRWPNMNAVHTAEGEPIMAGVLLVIPVTEQHNCCGL